MLSKEQDLAGLTSLVTGASKGIGAEIAIELARRGSAVVVNYASSAGAAQKVVDTITKMGGKAIALKADVTVEADLVGLFAEIKKTFGKLDVLVNNAGVYAFAPLEQITPEFYHKQFNLNVLGLIMATKHALPLFGESGGSIINISSIVAKLSLPGGMVYCASKAAVNSITMTMALELGARKIRVNAVNPGMVATEGNPDATDPDSEFRKMVISQTPLGRTGNVDDIAPAVAFFASPQSKWITGETLYITGGYR